MEKSIYIISLPELAFSFIPVMVVIAVLYKWSLDAKNALYAVARMFLQLLAVGYFLVFIFESDNPGIILMVLSVMLSASAWISMRTIPSQRNALLFKAFIAIAAGGGLTLILITQIVIDLKPWYQPRYMIPLAGMIFANAMNSISLAAERLQSELSRGEKWEQARNTAFRASLIPITNSLFAVGLVSLPGMMTGQILSGVSPLIAARYQIMVMCMVFGSAGIASSLFLILIRKEADILKSVS